jgi:hypothetical protein
MFDGPEIEFRAGRAVHSEMWLSWDETSFRVSHVAIDFEPNEMVRLLRGPSEEIWLKMEREVDKRLKANNSEPFMISFAAK